MTQITVMVTGVGGGAYGHQILKALRLADTNYRIIAGDISNFSVGMVQADEAYLLPAADDADYVAAVLKVCRKHNVSALFQGSEPELKAMSAARDEIRDQGIFLPINPAEVIALCMDKVKTCEFLKSRGFHISAYARITSEEDLKSFDRLPAVVKPSIGSGASANIFLAQTKEALMSFGRHLLSLYPEFVVQEYIGTIDSEYTVGVLIGMDGELLNSIGVKRDIMTSLSNRIREPNRTSRSELGPVLALSSGLSLGTIGRFPEVTEECERIAVALGARGTINIQCRLVDGKVYPFEINPRFSGTTSLRALVGYNEPDVLIRRQLLGERITPHFSYGSGVIMRGLAETLIEGQEFPKAQNL